MLKRPPEGGAPLTLAEPESDRTGRRPPSLPAALAGVFRDAWAVLRSDGTAVRIMALNALQLVSDKRLNDRFPSSSRATLVSVSSMAFSLVMIPLSPLFGWSFS